MASAWHLENGSSGSPHLDGGRKSSQDDSTSTPSEAAEKDRSDTNRARIASLVQGQKDGPEGGFDSTPIPTPSPGTIGYTLKITIHQATNLAMGDAHSFSSDPYVLAQINTELPMRHREDPHLRFRTQTVRKSTEPEWNEEWIVANVPSTGFQMKLRVYDEDPADHDDILGKVHLTVPQIDDHWRGFKLQPYKLELRDSSKRALLMRTFATALRFVHHVHGRLFLSIENLGRTKPDDQNGRLYTVGPCRWIRHYSPLLGRLAHTREPDEKSQAETPICPVQKRIEHYNFQANQIQLPGPVPAQLYHRFVEFRPWVRRMFSKSGFQGIVLGKALHHQHKRVYNFGRDTVWGYFGPNNHDETTKQFLELVHYDKGGRTFTYVLTLDALFRFTETGKEFGIDMLSKHTMHSDVSVYIAFSGEFFIRKLKQRQPPTSPAPTDDDHPNEKNQEQDLQGTPPEDDPPQDPSNYELIIDNDSGTYRPSAAMLPVLANYLSQCLPGLHIKTLDSQADADKMAKLKAEQRERKEREGDNVVYTQASDSSSVSSSDDERLEELQAAYHDEQSRKQHESFGDGRSRGRSTLETVAKDVKLEHDARMEKMMRNVGRKGRESDVNEFQGPRILADREHSGDVS